MPIDLPRRELRDQLEAFGIPREQHHRLALWALILERVGGDPIEDCTVDELAQTVIFLAQHGFFVARDTTNRSWLH